MNVTTSKDTIVAIATAVGMGGVGIVRISGADAYQLGKLICGQDLKPRYAHYGAITDPDTKDVIDYGLSLYFRAPHSYTGEDVVEFQIHGGTVVMNMLLKCVVKQGARLARAGEFTERAFLNDKMDLAQVEAVSDLISSSTEQAAKAAVRSLSGHFSSLVNDLLISLIEIRMHIEAALDFPEEEIDFLSDKVLFTKMDALNQKMQNVRQSVGVGKLLSEGMKIVILGQPNAGKSSLLNALTDEESAIVTDIEGTTRDVLSMQIQIDGLPINIVDTAGLRETSDVVEAEGVKRAWQAVESADRVFLLIDAQKGVQDEDIEIARQASIEHNIHVDIVFNKMDLMKKSPIQPENIKPYISDVLYCSVHENKGIEELRVWIKSIVGYESNDESVFTARQRHVDALDQTRCHIEQSRDNLHAGDGELAAEDLRLAQLSLSSVTGEFSNDDLLGEIFSSFCIGK